ncbi:MAG: hypothetical protein ACJ71G_19910, partial [Nitrososphaeraceae archaeon]
MKVNRPYADTKGDNKISRLGFLRLLGAGAIGYFAYRAGFINNLFGNATAADANMLPPQQASTYAAGRLDEDGILMMATPKPSGYSYRFSPTQDPTHDIKLDMHDTGGFEIKQEGAVKFIQFISHRPVTGGEGYTARLHIFTEN